MRWERRRLQSIVDGGAAVHLKVFTVRGLRALIVESSGLDGVACRNASLPHTTKRRITTHLKTMNNQKCQKIKLHGSPTARELKKQSPRLGRGVDGRWAAEQRGHEAGRKTAQARQSWLNGKLKTQS